MRVPISYSFRSQLLNFIKMIQLFYMNPYPLSRLFQKSEQFLLKGKRKNGFVPLRRLSLRKTARNKKEKCQTKAKGCAARRILLLSYPLYRFHLDKIGRAGYAVLRASGNDDLVPMHQMKEFFCIRRRMIKQHVRRSKFLCHDRRHPP